jgi:uncharacterized protein (TIGR02996 family)
MRYDAGFLEAICENPDDDVPRLVYADWLEERGDPRGEFIRLQCALASMPDDDERRWSLLVRERQLLWLYGKGWAGPVRRQVRRYAFRRGFVEAVTLGAADFLAQGEDLLRLAPVRQVRLLNAQACLAGLAASPLLNRLAGLDLRHTDGLDVARAWPLLRSPRLAGLRALGLRGTGLVSSPGLRALAACPHLTSLTALDLGDERGDADLGSVRILRQGWEAFQSWRERTQGNRLDTGAIRALVESQSLTALRSLALSGAPRGGLPLEALDLLFGSRLLAGLRELELNLAIMWDNRWQRTEDGDSLVRLGRAPQAAGLRRLRFAPRAYWAGSFPSGTYLSGLTTLEMDNVSLSVPCLSFIAGGAFPVLHTLRLRRCVFDSEPPKNETSVTLGKATGLRRLAALDLEETPVGPRMIQALTEEGTLLAGLRWLSLSNRGGYDSSPLGNDAVRCLAISPAASRLIHLDLSNNDLDDNAARALATSPHLGNLAALGLWHNHIGAEGAAALATSDALAALAFLDLRDNPLPASVRSGLRQRYGYGVRYGPGPVLTENRNIPAEATSDTESDSDIEMPDSSLYPRTEDQPRRPPDPVEPGTFDEDIPF